MWLSQFTQIKLILSIQPSSRGKVLIASRKDNKCVCDYFRHDSRSESDTATGDSPVRPKSDSPTTAQPIEPPEKHDPDSPPPTPRGPPPSKKDLLAVADEETKHNSIQSPEKSKPESSDSRYVEIMIKFRLISAQSQYS